MSRKYRIVAGLFESTDGGYCHYALQHKDFLFWKYSGVIGGYKEIKELKENAEKSEE